MKKVIAGIVALLVALAVWLLWFSRRTETGPNSSPSVVATAEASPTSKPAKEEGLTVAALNGIATLANRTIDFYGQVVDQDGVPVEGAEVTYTTQVMKVVSAQTFGDSFEQGTIKTSGSGGFEILGRQGSVLTIKELRKAGYIPSEHATSKPFRYWDNEDTRFRPDPAKPEVFKMWRSRGAEPLITRGISAALKHNGTPLEFDLRTGATVDRDGDLRVSLVRKPEKIEYGKSGYEWTLTIESPNGGLILSRDEQMFMAPEDGYVHSVVHHMSADSQDWRSRATLNLYVRMRDGKHYGRVEIRASAGSDQEASPFYVTSYVNPGGGRNLEYNSLQNFVQPPRQGH